VLLDLTTGQPRIRFTQHTNTIFDGAFSLTAIWWPLSVENAYETYIWRLVDGSVIRRLWAKAAPPLELLVGTPMADDCWGKQRAITPPTTTEGHWNMRFGYETSNLPNAGRVLPPRHSRAGFADAAKG